MSRSERNAAVLRRALGDARPPRSVEQRIVAGAMARLESGSARAPWRWWLGAAAATALGVGWLGLSTSLSTHAATPAVAIAIAPAVASDAPVTAVVAGQVHRSTAAATSYHIGAHQIRVGAATELRFVNTAPTAVALQLAQGNVRCAVEPLPAGGTFAVQTPQLRVEVVGTLFEVDSDAACSRVRVTEGRVRVSRDGDMQLLGAGEELVHCDEAPGADAAPAAPVAAPAVAHRAAGRQATAAPAGAPIIRAALAAIAADQPQAAVAAFEGYLAANPDGDLAEEALFHLAFVHQGLGDEAAARRVTARFIELFPGSRRAERLRRAILAQEK